MSRKNIIIPLALVIDGNVSVTAKVIYAVLKSFQIGKPDSVSASSVVVTHREIADRSNLSQNTVIKSLNKLDASGWITRRRTAGLPTRYIFSTPDGND